jgi:catechol 2,3-dioxygenase-like lactoylglutathione lyase family enzyme
MEKLIAYVQHEGIVTKDAERSKEFYTKLLGLTVLPRPPLPSRGYWLGGPEAEINPRSRHTCFEVSDYDGLKERMKRLEIAYVENQQANGTWQLLCNDPDGHTLEFQRPTT